MQQIITKGWLGKAIKECYECHPTQVKLASDYEALEAKIAAKRTGDPVMRSVYTDGFDSHSLNTYTFANGTEPWYSQITDPNDPNIINLIKTIAAGDRKASKPATFALQFLGDHKTLMNNLGYSEEKAKRIHTAYISKYVVYFDELKKLTDQAGRDGYITVAYGLRIDCPALAKSVAGSKVTPSVVAAEIRSISNAVCQSYGMMNTFAATDFMEAVWASKFRYTIMLEALIHDAIYTFAPRTLEAVEFVNHNLIKAMTSQTEANLGDYGIPLSAALDVHPQDWSKSFELPNVTNQTEIADLFNNYLQVNHHA